MRQATAVVASLVPASAGFERCVDTRPMSSFIPEFAEDIAIFRRRLRHFLEPTRTGHVLIRCRSDARAHYLIHGMAAPIAAALIPPSTHGGGFEELTLLGVGSRPKAARSGIRVEMDMRKPALVGAVAKRRRSEVAAISQTALCPSAGSSISKLELFGRRKPVTQAA